MRFLRDKFNKRSFGSVFVLYQRIVIPAEAGISEKEIAVILAKARIHTLI